MTTRKLVGLGIVISAIGALGATAEAAAPSIKLVPVLSGLAAPLFVTNARDGSQRLFTVEQGGVVQVLQPGHTSPTVFLDIASRVLSGGERGLLGLTFHPQFSSNRRFFVNYTRPPDGATVIAEYRVSQSDPNIADSTETVLLVIPQPFVNHNGGMVEFGHDGFLYIGMGDGGSGNDPGNRAQDITQLLGKILRIDVDHPNGDQPYSSPPSNPFFGSTPGADEIYAFGLRNPWRFSFDRSTGDLYAGDVGQGAVEEIDIITIGANYGWRIWEGTSCTGNDPGLCNPAGFLFPIDEYAHTGGRCSVIGGYVYRGAQLSLPVGSYVYGDLCTGEIFVLQNGTSSVALDTGLSISSFGEDESGEVYVVGLGGTVHRIAKFATGIQDFVTRFYVSVLERSPDPAGLATWTNFLQAHCNAAGFNGIAVGFFDSAEFRLAKPQTLTSLVTKLYNTFLGRSPEPAGLAAWVAVFRQARLLIATQGFIPSAEFQSILPNPADGAAVANLVTRFYTQVLQRAPEPAGLSAWVAFIQATGDFDSLAQGFLRSPEFESRALTFRDYVTILYRTFLGREPDGPGLDAWELVLRTKLLEVINTGFVPSPEFQSNVGTLCGT